MAHWAEINGNNEVLRVVVGNNDEPDEGYQWLMDNLGGTWIKTSYNGNIRKNYAGIGFTYDEERDAFIPPKPFTSWLLNEDTCQWEAPTPRPEELMNVPVKWDEETLSWKALIEE
jgi:hypothetical protein